MKLDSIVAQGLNIPFNVAFRHAAAERAATQTLWVTAHSAQVIGYGESCPREYVTGESLQSAAAFVARHSADWRTSICDLASLRWWAQSHAAEIDRNPSGWCAAELALLDLLARSRGVSVESLLGLPCVTGRFRYSAVLGDAPAAQFQAQLGHYQKAGFRDFKIKLSSDRARDLEKTRALVAAGLAADAVRADANNLWHDANEAIAELKALDFRFGALEEPLRAGDYGGLARIGEALDTHIILDESVLRVGHLDELTGPPERWIVNLRVSKMGGVLRSLQLIEGLRARRIGVIVGAQVGETSLLTRSALTVAHAARDILIAQEGAFGTHLLARDVTEPPLMFGQGGVLDTTPMPFDRPGWGLPMRAADSDLVSLVTAP